MAGDGADCAATPAGSASLHPVRALALHSRGRRLHRPGVQGAPSLARGWVASEGAVGREKLCCSFILESRTCQGGHGRARQRCMKGPFRASFAGCRLIVLMNLLETRSTCTRGGCCSIDKALQLTFMQCLARSYFNMNAGFQSPGRSCSAQLSGGARIGYIQASL